MNLNNLTSSGSGDAGTNAKNILTNDVEVTGTLKFASELIFDGKLDGEIVSDGVLTLGKNAHVKGEVKTKSVTVHGTVEGNITVTERCELKSSSQLTGDLRATRIIIEEGATFVGKSEVTPGRAVTRESTTESGSRGKSISASSGTPGTPATSPAAA
jgi:cytoskeletal protein CcmA (bactofilin family)